MFHEYVYVQVSLRLLVQWAVPLLAREPRSEPTRSFSVSKILLALPNRINLITGHLVISRFVVGNVEEVRVLFLI